MIMDVVMGMDAITTIMTVPKAGSLNSCQKLQLLCCLWLP